MAQAGSCEVCQKDTRFNCSVCTVASYCSQECQSLHWPIHKNRCKPPPSPEDPLVVYSATLEKRGTPGAAFSVNQLSIDSLQPVNSVAVLTALLRAGDALLSFSGQFTEEALTITVTTPRKHMFNYEYLMPLLTTGAVTNLWGKIALSKRMQALRDEKEIALRHRSMAPVHWNDGSHGEFVTVNRPPVAVFDLLDDMSVLNLLKYLSLQDLCRVSMVSTRFHRLASVDGLWDYCYWLPAEHIDLALGVQQFSSAAELFLRAHSMLMEYQALSLKGKVLQHLSLRDPVDVCSGCGVHVLLGHHLRHSRTMIAAMKEYGVKAVANLSLMCHRCYLLCATNFAKLRDTYKHELPKTFWNDSVLLSRRNFTHNSAKSVLWLDVRTLLREQRYQRYLEDKASGHSVVAEAQPALDFIAPRKVKQIDTSSLVLGQLRDASFLDQPPPITMPPPQPADLCDQNITLLQQLGFAKRTLVDGVLAWEEIPGGVEEPRRGKKKMADDDEEFELSGEVEEEEISSEEYSNTDDENYGEEDSGRANKRSRVEEEQYEEVDPELKRWPQEVLDLLTVFGYDKAQASHPEFKEAEAMWDYAGDTSKSQLVMAKGDKIVLYFWSDVIGWSMGALLDHRFTADGRLQLGMFPNNYVKITKRAAPPAPKLQQAFTGSFISRGEQQQQQQQQQGKRERPTRAAAASTRSSRRSTRSRRKARDEEEEDAYVQEDDEDEYE